MPKKKHSNLFFWSMLGTSGAAMATAFVIIAFSSAVFRVINVALETAIKAVFGEMSELGVSFLVGLFWFVAIFAIVILAGLGGRKVYIWNNLRKKIS